MSIDLAELKSQTIHIRIAARLKAIRAIRGTSLKKLSEDTGISIQTLSRIENGLQDFKLSTIGKIEEALGCTLIVVPNEDLI